MLDRIALEVADLGRAARFYDALMQPLGGRRIVDYVGRDGQLDAFYERLEPLLDFLLPQYVAEGKAHLTIAIGCTGGRHRSVAIAEHLGARYSEREDILVSVVHRDVTRADRRDGDRAAG